MAVKEKIEEKLAKLNKLVEQFEQGEVGLEDSIEEYKKAQKIMEDLKTDLESLELKIKEIREQN